jgi:hypothetical protein
MKEPEVHPLPTSNAAVFALSDDTAELMKQRRFSGYVGLPAPVRRLYPVVTGLLMFTTLVGLGKNARNIFALISCLEDTIHTFLFRQRRM